MKYTIELIEDEETGELILPLPEEVTNLMELSIGDTVIFNQDGDSWVLTKKK